MTENDTLWRHIDAMFARHAPSVFRAFKAPATAGQIAIAEEAMQLEFPEDVRCAYLHHNGSMNADEIVLAGGGHSSLFLWIDTWASLDEAVAMWRQQHEWMLERRVRYPNHFPDQDPSFELDEIRLEGWNKKRIPVGVSETSSVTYIDLAPARLGTLGQLITDDGSMQPHLEASSLNAYLEALLRAIESGDVVHDARFGWIGGKKRFEIHSLWPEFKLTNYPVPL
jgi:cell wall assembly regulator SMI1